MMAILPGLHAHSEYFRRLASRTEIDSATQSLSDRLQPQTATLINQFTMCILITL